MNKVKIITDSCADLSRKLLKKNDIDYVKMCTVLDEKSSPALLTWNADEAHALYETMRSGKRITTSQVPVEEFNRVFEKYLKSGYDIVYIGCSSKQSGSVNTGHMTAQKLLEIYPDAKISCIDSLNASIGEGMLAIEASKMAADGLNADEITKKVLALRNKVNQYVTVHSLDTLRKAGRVTGSAAFFGNLMGVKPIIISDADGTQTPIKKVKGRKNSFREIVSLLKESIVDPKHQTIYIAHGDCSREEVEELRTLVRNEIPCRNVEVWYIGPIVGASIGPDAIGVWGFGNEVTYRVGDAK